MRRGRGMRGKERRGEEGGREGRRKEERKGDEREGEKRRGRGTRKVSVVNSERRKVGKRQLCMFFSFCLLYVYLACICIPLTYTH